MSAEKQSNAPQNANKVQQNDSPPRPKAPRPPGKPVTIVKRGVG